MILYLILTIQSCQTFLVPNDRDNTIVRFDQTEIAEPTCDDFGYNFTIAGPGYIKSGFSNGSQYIEVIPSIPDELVKLAKTECSTGKYASLVRLAESEGTQDGHYWNVVAYDDWISNGEPGLPSELDAAFDTAFEKLREGLADYQIAYVDHCPDLECERDAYSLFGKDMEYRMMRAEADKFQREVQARGSSCEEFARGQIYNLANPVKLVGNKCSVVIR